MQRTVVHNSCSMPFSHLCTVNGEHNMLIKAPPHPSPDTHTHIWCTPLLSAITMWYVCRIARDWREGQWDTQRDEIVRATFFRSSTSIKCMHAYNFVHIIGLNFKQSNHLQYILAYINVLYMVVLYVYNVIRLVIPANTYYICIYVCNIPIEINITLLSKQNKIMI